MQAQITLKRGLLPCQLFLSFLHPQLETFVPITIWIASSTPHHGGSLVRHTRSHPSMIHKDSVTHSASYLNFRTCFWKERSGQAAIPTPPTFFEPPTLDNSHSCASPTGFTFLFLTTTPNTPPRSFVTLHLLYTSLEHTFGTSK